MKKLDSNCNLEFYNLLKSMNNGFYDYYRTHIKKADKKFMVLCLNSVNP